MAIINRAKGLTGLNPLAYMGVEGSEAGNTVVPLVAYPEDPGPTDWQNFNLMTLWLNTSNNNLWYLASLAGNQALWLMLAGGSGDIIGVKTDDGNTAVPVAGIIDLFAQPQAGSTVVFTTTAPNIIKFNVSDANANTLIGLTAGNSSITGTANTGLGLNVLGSLTSGASNCGLGWGTQQNITSGSYNCAVGAASQSHINSGNNNTAVGYVALQFLTTGNNNTAVGDLAGQLLITGSGNICIGASSGVGMVGSEASNIYIGNAGASESNTIRLGTVGTQTSNYQAGIYGASVGATSAITITDNTGKLGTNGSFVDYSSWTPTLVGETTTGVTTITSAVGRYSRIGNTIIASFTLQWTAATGTGNVNIGGFPGTSINVSGMYFTGSIAFGSAGFPWPESSTMLTAEMFGNVNFCRIIGSATGETLGAGTYLQMTNNAGALRGTLIYGAQ
jgi:hypothetical protein